MIYPTFKFLTAMPMAMSQAQGVGNPKFYKYFWRVFHKGSPNEGREFLRDRQNRMTTADAMDLIESLKASNEPHIVYNSAVPRLPSPGGSIWDVNAARWAGVEWAPAFEDDTDRECGGHR